MRVPSEVGYDQNEVLRHTVLTQYTLKKGLQVFGPPGGGCCLQITTTITRTWSRRTERCRYTVSNAKKKCIGVPHVPQTETYRTN